MRIILVIVLILSAVTAHAIEPQLFGAVTKSESYTEYVRARAIAFINPIAVDGTTSPKADIWLEKCRKYDDGTTKNCADSGKITVDYDPVYTFPLVNPETLANIGTGNYPTIFVYLYSLTRDQLAKQAAAQTAIPTP